MRPEAAPEGAAPPAAPRASGALGPVAAAEVEGWVSQQLSELERAAEEELRRQDLEGAAALASESEQRSRLEEELEAREHAEALREQQRAVEASRTFIRNDLQDFLQRNPDGTFTAWIASLHPENVTLDPRLLNDNNPWQAVWDEAAGGGSLRRLRCCWRRGGREALLADRQLRRPPAGWGGAVDVTLGGVFTLVAVVIVVVFEALRGLLLGIARLLELGRRQLPSKLCSADQPCAALAAAPVCLLWAVWLPLWLLSVIVLCVGVVALELVAAVAALACGVASLSPRQAVWTHGLVRHVAFATQAAVRRGLVRAGVLQGGHVARAELQTLGQEDASSPEARWRSFVAGALATAGDGRPWQPGRRRAAGGAAAGEGPREGAGAPRAPSAEGAELE